MRTAACLVLLSVATLPWASARADPAYLDLPVTQSVNRDGVIRYGVWVKIGERSVEAMIDTGSTGLRVLPTVLPGEFPGQPTDVAFGAGLHMAGPVTIAPVEIGSLTGQVPVEVVDSIRCVADRPNCDVTHLSGDSYLIGGDGYPSEGYSAILGIGLPFQATDLGNPLAALGVKYWIVELPRPNDDAAGHLILNPAADRRAGFSMLARHGSADADGCIAGGPLAEPTCGTVLFDTGAPTMVVSQADTRTASRWNDGAAGALTFTSDAKLDDPKTLDLKTFRLDFHAGDKGGLIGVLAMPLERRNAREPFIIAGVDPYFTYDILYDAAAHAVGLKSRDARPAPTDPDSADLTASIPRTRQRHASHRIGGKG